MSNTDVIMRQLQIADQRWEAAIADSAYAPPDSRFSERLRAIASAAEAEALVLHQAAASPELRWNPVTDRMPKGLTYELRPGGNRPGPGDLWAEFDRVVEALDDAQTGNDFSQVADAYRALGQIAMRLAGAVDATQTPPDQQRDAG